MKPIERVKEIIVLNDISISAFEKAVGLSNNSIQIAIKRVSNLKDETLNSILNKYEEINPTWLLTGEGDMFKETLIKQIGSTSNTKGVPYYDVDFTLGFLELENNQQIQPNSYISHPFFLGCDYVVRASGQSMAKVIHHGDAIGLIKLDNWFEFLPFGEIYAIVTKNGYRMIKVITKGEKEDSYTLISKPTDNKKDEFPPQQIKKENIISIFKVQALSHLF